MADSMASSVLRSMRAASREEWIASFRPRLLFSVFASPLTPFRQAASVSLTVSQAWFSASYARRRVASSGCERRLISICTNYFVASWETLITNRKPAGAVIEAIGIADLFIFVRQFHPVSLRFLWPKASVGLPLSLPLFSWSSGHSRALRDTEGHK